MSLLGDRAGASSGSATVLIVEDERELADLYATWLADRHHVLTAYDGRQALEKLHPGVDVVLLDRRMPGLSGDEVLGRIRERDGEYQVALVTAVDPDFDVLKLDFDTYVTKPLSREELQETVERLLIRGTFEEDLQRVMALAAKKKTLESRKTATELRDNTTYQVLTGELAQYREQVDDRLTRLAEREPSTSVPYSPGQIARSSLVIGLIAAVLVGIHLGIPDARGRLLGYGSPSANVLVPYLLTFVHLDDVHLLGNVVGYLLGAFFTYALCMRIRAVRWFYLTVPLLLTLLPVGTLVVSQGLFALLYPGTETVLLGFSTVVAGFVGFAFLAFLFVARTIYDHRTVFFIGAFVLLVLVDSLLAIDRDPLAVVSVVATVLVFALIVNARSRAIAENRTLFVERLVGLLVATIFFTTFGLGLFPALAFTSARATNAATTNVFGHFLGVLVGFTIAFATAFLADVFPIRERIRRDGHVLPDRLL